MPDKEGFPIFFGDEVRFDGRRGIVIGEPEFSANGELMVIAERNASVFHCGPACELEVLTCGHQQQAIIYRKLYTDMQEPAGKLYPLPVTALRRS